MTTLTLTNHIANNASLEKKAFRILTALFLGLSVIYGFYILNITWNVIERKDAEKSSAALTASMNELELSYLELSDTITPTLAQDLGLHEPEVTAFIERNASVSMLALNGNDN